MPIVDIKGVGKAKFPDGMSAESIRDFLRVKYSQQAVSGQSDILSPQPDTVAPYSPSLVDKIGGGIADTLTKSGLISDNYRAQQIGKNLSGIGEFLPGVGDATAGDEFGRAVAKGDKLGMSLAALGVIPVAGDLAKKGIKLSKSPFDLGGAVNDRLSVDGSHIDVVESKWSPTKFSIVEFLTDESARGQGKGGKLLDEAINKYGDELSGAFSSKESLTAAYNRGFRPTATSNKNKSLEQLSEGLKGGESVTMSFKGVNAEKGTGSKVDLKPFEDALKVEEEKYALAFKPLQAEYKLATPDRKKQLMAQSRQLKKPVSFAISELSRAKSGLIQKQKSVTETTKPNKTFKGKVFHQTSEQFDEFDLSKGADGTAWFTGNKKNFTDPQSSASAASGKGRILEREVDLKKVAGFKELDQFSVDELRQKGYDGAVLDGDIQVFDQKAIKQSLPMDEVRFKATSSEANTDAMRDLLSDPGKAVNIGQEKGKKVKNGTSKLTSPYGSTRYVEYVNGEPVSALQVMSMDGKRAKIANIFTVESEQKKGIASRLLKRARKDFDSIEHSDDLTNEGARFANSVER